jgi:hypothetical protein
VCDRDHQDFVWQHLKDDRITKLLQYRAPIRRVEQTFELGKSQWLLDDLGERAFEEEAPSPADCSLR